MLRFTEQETGMVLRRLYDSEINIEISSFWDGGYDFRIGDHANGFLEIDKSNLERTSPCSAMECVYGSTGVVCDMISHLAFHAATKYPDSHFAKWYIEQQEQKCKMATLSAQCYDKTESISRSGGVFSFTENSEL